LINLLVAFFFVLGVAFVRAAFFDVLEVQGDMIVGVETLPITLGEKRTLSLLKYLIISASLILIIPPLFRTVPFFSLLMLIPLFALAFLLHAYEKGRIQHGPLLEYLIEGNFLAAGILAFIWQKLS
jgi:4-hydroxybenzoate polyprenyltransferase